MDPAPIPDLEVAGPGRSAAVALREVQHWASPLLSLPQIKLRNPHNACYFNSCVQAFFWFGALVGEDRETSGATKAGIAVFKTENQSVSA